MHVWLLLSTYITQLYKISQELNIYYGIEDLNIFRAYTNGQPDWLTDWYAI